MTGAAPRGGFSCKRPRRSILFQSLRIEHGQQYLGIIDLFGRGANGNRAAGMGGGVDRLQVADRDLSVEFGCGQFGVAEHGLDEPDVGAVLQHQRRHGVSEKVAGTLLADVRPLHIIPNKRRQTVRRERLTKARQKQYAIVATAEFISIVTAWRTLYYLFWLVVEYALSRTVYWRFFVPRSLH